MHWMLKEGQRHRVHVAGHVVDVLLLLEGEVLVLHLGDGEKVVIDG